MRYIYDVDDTYGSRPVPAAAHEPRSQSADEAHVTSDNPSSSGAAGCHVGSGSETLIAPRAAP
eukprot:3933264-Prymnesium_polylepis.1